MTYEDLPQDIKIMYSKKQCEAIIVASRKLNMFINNAMEALRKIIVAMQPTIERLSDIYKKEFNKNENINRVKSCLNIKPKFLPYRSKAIQFKIHRKINYCARSNC